MEERHRSLLRRHILSFRKDLEPKKLLSHLVSVLDTYDEQEIKKEPTREDQVEKLLEILPRKGPSAFCCFLEGLEAVQPHLAVALRKEEEMEKKLFEVESELGLERSHSAKLRDELRSTSVSLESEKNIQESVRKELAELKSLHKALLYQSKHERENLVFNINELNNINEKLKRELEHENLLRSDLHNKCCKLEEESSKKSQEITDLKSKLQRLSEREHLKNGSQLSFRKSSSPNSRTLSFDETKARSSHEMMRKRTYSEQIGSLNGKEQIVGNNDEPQDRAADNVDILHDQCENNLESMQQNVELVELEQKLSLFMAERDQAVALSKELLEKLKVHEEKKSCIDKSTAPMEVSENFTCNKCAELESECEKAKQDMEIQTSSLKEEAKMLKCKLKELTENFERERKSLETKRSTFEEMYNLCKMDHANELKSVRNEMTEQHFNEMKSVREEFTCQIDKEKLTISRIRWELDKERDTNKSNLKDFDKFKKKANSEKKQLKQKHDQEMKSKNSSLKDIENELKELKESEKRNLDEKSKLMVVIKEQNETQEHLTEELERWRTLPGRVFNYKKDFDRNGIIYFLGSKHIQVMRSSNDQGQPEDILDTKRGTLCCTRDAEHSWWRLDFGEDRSLFATHYTLRHGRDNGMSVIRNWNLEGSNNCRDWKILKKHENDRGLNKGNFPYFTGTWTIEGNIEAMRYFRIHQTGKNASGRHALCLSGFEIYGVLLDMR